MGDLVFREKIIIVLTQKSTRASFLFKSRHLKKKSILGTRLHHSTVFLHFVLISFFHKWQLLHRLVCFLIEMAADEEAFAFDFVKLLPQFLFTVFIKLQRKYVESII